MLIMANHAAPAARIVTPDLLTPAQREAARAEAARLDPVHTDTIAADPGAFGAALAGLGFDRMVEVADDGWHGRYIVADRSTDDVRVVTRPDDGDRVEVFAWDRTARSGTHLLAWKADFDGSTPQDVVLAAIAVATGHLSVTR
jgi:hypothetical protein